MSRGVIVRGSIYVALAGLTAFSGWLDDLTPETLPTLTWLEWARMGVAVVVAGLLALRAYIDGSAERAKTGG